MTSLSLESPSSAPAVKSGQSDFFVTRQPIFENDGSVFAYELLFHSCSEEAADAADAKLAGSLVASDFFSAGTGRMLSGKKAFLKFPAEMLAAGVPLLVPRKLIVVEIPDTIEIDADILGACRNLKQNGYRLALTNFHEQGHFGPLVDLADIIKVNFAKATASDRRRLSAEHRARGVAMLADNVQTQEDFESARGAGYSYFQGFFFAKPSLATGKELSGFKRNYLRILAELHRSDLDYDEIIRLIKQETTLSSKLLAYINSAVFSLRGTVSSLNQALAMLGEKTVRHWISATALACVAREKPGELVRHTMLRARFCESIARQANFALRQQTTLFLIGMFSLLDAMVDRPLDELLSGLPVPASARNVLLGNAPDGDRWAEVFASARAYESADWSALSSATSRLGIPSDVMPQLYLESADWSAEVCRSAAVL